MKMRCIIIEDEEKSRILLESLLETHISDVEVVGQAATAKEAIKQIDELKPDLIFLDIHLPDEDGFYILENSKYNSFHIIFLTAYEQFAVKAFEFSASHYLLKPVQLSGLETALQKCREKEPLRQLDQLRALMENSKGNINQLALPNQKGFDLVQLNEVIRIQAEGNYSRFFLQEKGSLLVSLPLARYELMLKDSGFFRIHKKHLINLAQLKSYRKGKSGYVLMNDNMQIGFSYERRKELLEALKQVTYFS
jgi:two-component system LytT family response regulator